MMDDRGVLVSHMLDDVRSICSLDDDACSIDGDASSPVRSCKSSTAKAGGGGLSVADAYAYVASPDQSKELHKPERNRASGKARSSRQHPVSSTVVASTVPQRPVKWQLRLADRATASVNLEAQYQVPPNVLFDLLANPFQHERIFDAIEAADAELLEEDGPRCKWRLDYTARWNFWKVSGVCENRLFMWTDRDAGTVTFKLREPGFLKRYEGTWTIKPACGTPMSECYRTDLDSPMSSTSASPASSRDSSPMRGGGLASLGSGSSTDGASSSSSRVVSWPSTPPAAAAAASYAGSPGMLSGVRMSPLASVNLTMSAATVGSSSSSYLPPVRLTGAVAAIARMQADWQASVNNSMTTLSALANNIANSAAVSSTNSGLSTIGQTLQEQLARINTPWTGRLPSRSGSSSSSSSSKQDKSNQQRRRELPTTALITAETYTSPKITPPYPLNALLKNQSKGQVEEMLTGLVQAAVNEAGAHRT